MRHQEMTAAIHNRISSTPAYCLGWMIRHKLIRRGDQAVAEVVTYLRQSWGNRAGPGRSEGVDEYRAVPGG